MWFQIVAGQHEMCVEMVEKQSVVDVLADAPSRKVQDLVTALGCKLRNLILPPKYHSLVPLEFAAI